VGNAEGARLHRGKRRQGGGASPQGQGFTPLGPLQLPIPVLMHMAEHHRSDGRCGQQRHKQALGLLQGDGIERIATDRHGRMVQGAGTSAAWSCRCIQASWASSIHPSTALAR
jgi:hypothetical protein